MLIHVTDQVWEKFLFFFFTVISCRRIAYFYLIEFICSTHLFLTVFLILFLWHHNHFHSKWLWCCKGLGLQVQREQMSCLETGFQLNDPINKEWEWRGKKTTWYAVASELIQTEHLLGFPTELQHYLKAITCKSEMDSLPLYEKCWTCCLKLLCLSETSYILKYMWLQSNAKPLAITITEEDTIDSSKALLRVWPQW